MRRQITASALLLTAATAGTAFANTMEIDQAPAAVPGAGFTDAVFIQQPGGGNTMTVDVQGAIETVAIDQDGLGNVLTMTVSTRDDSTGSYVISYLGDSNVHTLNVGDRTGDPLNLRFPNAQYALSVDGSGNVLSERFRGAGTFSYDGTVTGDNNAVFMNSGARGPAVGSIDYVIDGNQNTLDVDTRLLFNRTVDVSITGDRNSVTYSNNQVQGNTIFRGVYVGDDIESTVTDVSTGGFIDVTLVKTEPGVFIHNIFQDGVGSTAVMEINAAGGGTFDLTQGTVNASFTGTMTVAVNGSVVATQ